MNGRIAHTYRRFLGAGSFRAYYRHQVPTEMQVARHGALDISMALHTALNYATYAAPRILALNVVSLTTGVLVGAVTLMAVAAGVSRTQPR